jgi:hypothetical protein
MNATIKFSEGIIAEDTEGYIACIDDLLIIEVGKTKQEALNECVKSFAVLLAHNSGLDVPEFVLLRP